MNILMKVFHPFLCGAYILVVISFLLVAPPWVVDVSRKQKNRPIHCLNVPSNSNNVWIRTYYPAVHRKWMDNKCLLTVREAWNFLLGGIFFHQSLTASCHLVSNLNVALERAASYSSQNFLPRARPDCLTENDNGMTYTRGETISSTCSFLSKESGDLICYSNNQIRVFDWSISRDSSISLRCSDVGMIYMPEKKAAAVFPQLRRDDTDTKQSGTEAPIHEGCSDQNKSLHLSSGCIAPLLVSNGCQPPDAFKFDSRVLSPDDQFCLAQSMSFSYIIDRISVFDGSRINPLEEASLVLDGTPDDIAKVCEEEEQAGEVVAWLHDSLESEIKYSSLTCTESTGSSYDNSLSEDSSVLDSSWSSLSTNEDSCSQVCDLYRTDIWLSVLKLEQEDCKWASDKMQGFNDLPPHFPSPSFHTKQNSYFKSSDYRSPFSQESSNADLLSEPTSEAKEQFLCEGSCKLDLEGFNSDEPLFWPFDQNSKWHLETDWCCLSISPRKDIGLFGKKSASLMLPERRGALLQSRALKGGQSRRILFESKSSVSSTISCKTKDGNKHVAAIGCKPSRLSCSNHCSSEQRSHCASMKNSPTSQISSVEALPSHLQPQVSRQELQLNKKMNSISKMSTEKSTKTKNENEEPDAPLIQPSLERFAEVDLEFLFEGLDSSKEAPIESLVGLSEFNGHEGIETEFDEGGFFLDGL